VPAAPPLDPGSGDPLDGAAGWAVPRGVGFGFVADLVVGADVGLGAALAVGFGFGFVITTRLGETVVSVTERAPDPLPLEAANPYPQVPAGSFIVLENVTPD
jgi:hypothetical protein